MNTITSNITVLDRLLAVNLDINLWSARKKLNSEDIGDIELPPEELASLGSKRIAPPESIRIFNTLKSRAFSFLDKHGVRFMSGWAIPEDKADIIIAELETIKRVFLRNRDEFLQEYDQIITDWLEKNGEWANIIKTSIVGQDHVRNKFNFSWQLYKVALSKNDNTDSGLVEEVEGLGSTLYGEIAKTATEIWDKVYKNKTEVTRKALSPLRTLQQKLIGLSFVEPHISQVANLIQLTIDNLPSKGSITGSNLLMLQGLVAILRDPANLIEQSKLINQGQSPLAILESVIAKPLPIFDEPEIIELMPDFIPAQVPTISSLGLW